MVQLGRILQPIHAAFVEIIAEKHLTLERIRAVRHISNAAYPPPYFKNTKNTAAMRQPKATK